ncbi:TPA: transposase [Enterococcus faecalis]|nr:hypothetical protein D347_01295 [Enterococcus faecalis LA3B-2]HAP3559348.1 transposase [Enterococcus faecalis]
MVLKMYIAVISKSNILLFSRQVFDYINSNGTVKLLTDTERYSDMVSGLFAFLDYQFSPRIKDSGNSRLWRMNKEANYGLLDSLSQNKINTKLIVKHWEKF